MESVNLGSLQPQDFYAVPGGEDDFASVLDQVSREQAQTQAPRDRAALEHEHLDHALLD